MKKSLIIILLLVAVIFVLDGGNPAALLLPCLLGMAKVQGPLFSIEARGALAQAMVYFPWKGRNIVRKWMIPSNPQTGAQGDRRNILGGLGRGAAVVNTLSQFATFARVTAGAGQTWVSGFVKHMMTTYFASVAAYTAHHEEEEAHDSHAIFGEHAAIIGLTHYAVAYKAMPIQFTNNHQLYCLAKYGCDKYILNNAHFNAAPYTKALATWVEADIVLLLADFAAL